MRKLLVGIVGQQGSGKDTAGNYLAKRIDGKHISSSDLIRRWITTHSLGDTTRDNLQTVVEELRKQKGNAILMELALRDPADILVISGLRNKEEADLLKRNGGIIVAIEADQKKRFARSRKRGRVGDNISFARFKAQQAYENDPARNPAFNIADIVSRAEYKLSNDGTKADFFGQIDELSKKLRVGF